MRKYFVALTLCLSLLCGCLLFGGLLFNDVLSVKKLKTLVFVQLKILLINYLIIRKLKKSRDYTI